jgi:signal transduction histidine kinase
VALVGVLLAALVAAVAAVSVDRFDRSTASNRAAIRAGHDRVLVETATAAHWRERDAILGASFAPSSERVRGARTAVAQFRRALGDVVVDSPEERRAVAEIGDANDAFVAAGRRVGRTVTAAQLAALAGVSDRVLRGLAALDAVNVREETEAESAASSDASTARTIAIVAFALLIAVALARAVYVTRLVRRVASQNEELRQLDAVKDELIATVSHEFRTPLTSVQGYLELLEDEADELNEEHLKYIAIARRSSERLLRLVNDLLLLAEIDDRRFSLDKTSVEL